MKSPKEPIRFPPEKPPKMNAVTKPTLEILWLLAVIFACVVALFCFSACSTRGVVDAGGGAAGAGLAYAASGGNPYVTAGGAAVGALGTDLLQGAVEKGKQNKVQEGYELGASDTAKTTYEILQSSQKPKDQENNLPTKLYTIPAPDPSDGTNRNPSTITIPIVQNQ